MSEPLEEHEDLIDVDLDEDSVADSISILAITDRENVQRLLLDFDREYASMSVNNFGHSDSSSFEQHIESADILLIEFRIMGMLNDLQTVRDIRAKRPLMPIVVISENMDSEVMLMAYKEGINDYLHTSSTIDILAAKIKSFHKITKSSRLIEVQNEQIVSTMTSLREANNQLRQEAASRVLAETERDIADEMALILKQNKEILDNLTSGFFTIRKDLSIGMTTSKACETIFSNEIAGKQIGDIFNLVDKQEPNLELALEQLFENILPFSVNISLLKKQFETKDGKIIDFHYTTVFDADEEPMKIIVVATDISETVAKQQAMQKQVNHNKSLINIITNMESFSSFLNHYREETLLLKVSSKLKESKRLLHTLKGNSSIFGIEVISKRIHEMETNLTNFGDNEESAIKEIKSYALELEDLMRNYLVENHAVLQIDFDKDREEEYNFEKSHIDALYGLCSQLTDDIRRKFEVILDLHKLANISTFTSIYQNIIAKLSAKLNKKIELKISGEDLKIDKKSYEQIFENLVHAITNACDHGIEQPDMRADLGKPVTGHIELDFSKTAANELLISVKDDGRGLDTERLRSLAIKNNIFTPEEAASKPPEEIYELIFHDGLSTAKKVSQTSGRGVGMAALKEAAEALDGTIKVSSLKDQGALIQITIPGVF